MASGKGVKPYDPLKVEKTDHPDLVGGVIWADCELEWIRARWSIPDRERGAIRRLDKLMARYPGLRYYLQTDPRGAYGFPVWAVTSIYRRQDSRAVARDLIDQLDEGTW